MATNAKTAAAAPAPPPPASNGVITGPPKANRKKQKRRAKQAAKQAANEPLSAPGGEQPTYDEDPLGYDDEYDDEEYEDDETGRYNDQFVPPHAGTNGLDLPPPAKKSNKKKKKGSVGHGTYDPNMLPPLPNPPPPPSSANALRAMPKGPGGKDASGNVGGNIWNTSTQQERQNIKDFWLSLSEDERKSLLKIEKEAVLRKMKQQQKHSCSCTVCGRKRTAIEEELEVLYEGYYEELEQYAHHDHPPLSSTDGLMPDPLQHRRPPHPLAAPPPQHPHHKTSALHEHLDDEIDYSDVEDEDGSEDLDEEEEYSDEDDEEYSDTDSLNPETGAPPHAHHHHHHHDHHHHSHSHLPPPRAPGVPDFLNFGQNLTVKGILTPWLERLQQGLKGKADNLLTVADDLLKNDGRKFIEMMEQLAERRMRRENEAEYAAVNPSHPGGGHAGGPLGGGPPGAYPSDGYGGTADDPLAAGGEGFDDDEESYASGEEYEDEEMEEDEEVNGLTEEQRMQEGRRMFQIFAARMFEQRVLNAYREKQSAERTARLLDELENEEKMKQEREAKKQRDAQKKKEKKKQQAAAKAEEKAKRDAEKAAEEARLKEAEEKKAEEVRRKKEEQRRKREEEKRKADDERAKKEAEKSRRLQEEQRRKEEAERKRVAEKAKKDELRKREREEKEARDREEREKREREEKEKRESEAKAKAEKEAEEREKAAQQGAQPPLQVPQQQQARPQAIQKRPSQIGMVAVPGMYPKQTASGISSPHPSIATPAIPKAPTPAKGRQASQQGSHASSPKQAQSQVSSAPSKSSSPGNAPGQQVQQQQQLNAGERGPPPKSILQKSSNQHMGGPQQHPMQTSSPLHQGPMQPPPGMPLPGQHPPGGFGAMSPMGFPNFQQHGPQGPMMQGGHMGGRGPVPMFPGHQQHHGPPAGMPHRGMPGGWQGMNGMPPPPPPGMMGRGMPFGFDQQPPPGFPAHQQQPSSQQQAPGHGSPVGQHGPMQSQQQGMPPLEQVPRGSISTNAHSRQPSASEKDRFESAASQPIARPAPIQRPSSVKPPASSGADELEDLNTHLGSSALLADDDEPAPPPGDSRRHSGMQGRNGMPGVGMGALGGLGSPAPGFGQWNAPSLQGLPPFGPAPGLGQSGLGGGPTQQWGGLPTPGGSVMGGWAQNQHAFAANGLNGGAFGGMGAPSGAMHRPQGAGVNRPLTIRLAVCQACKQLSNAARGEGDGFFSVEVLLRQMEMNRLPLEAAPTLKEIEEICETEGSRENGGGELRVRKAAGAEEGGFAVKWEPDAGTPDQLGGRGANGLGEIGSPMPSKSSPAVGFGAPGMGRGMGIGGFQSLGAF